MEYLSLSWLNILDHIFQGQRFLLNWITFNTRVKKLVFSVRDGRNFLVLFSFYQETALTRMLSYVTSCCHLMDEIGQDCANTSDEMELLTENLRIFDQNCSLWFECCDALFLGQIVILHIEEWLVFAFLTFTHQTEILSRLESW